MRVQIEFSCKNAAFDNFEDEVNRVLQQALRKVMLQKDRPDALCDHPESLDVLLDINGNTIGSVKLDKDPRQCFKVQIEELRNHVIEVRANNEDEVGEAALEAHSSGVGVMDTQVNVEVLHDTIEECEG
jgi:hypothetical protein